MIRQISRTLEKKQVHEDFDELVGELGLSHTTLITTIWLCGQTTPSPGDEWLYLHSVSPDLAEFKCNSAALTKHLLTVPLSSRPGFQYFR